jgi:energy-coupling factor transport system substrate-specific component
MANTGQGVARGGLFSRIAGDFTTRAWVLVPIGIGINVVGGFLAEFLRLPIFLDVIGTILVALLAGPWVGALTGLITNIVLGVANPTTIAFAPVNVAIGLIAGYLALRGWFKSYVKLVLAGLIITVTAILISSPIVTYLFGGVGGSGVSLVRAYFIATGSTILESVLKTAAIVEPIDKIASVFIALFIARAIPERYRPGKARQTLP